MNLESANDRIRKLLSLHVDLKGSYKKALINCYKWDIFSCTNANIQRDILSVCSDSFVVRLHYKSELANSSQYIHPGSRVWVNYQDVSFHRSLARKHWGFSFFPPNLRSTKKLGAGLWGSSSQILPIHN